MNLNPETDQLMRDLADFLPLMKRNLEEGGYIFDRPQEVLESPSPNISAMISNMRRGLGSFPYTLESLYTRIGSVDFCGSTRAFEETEYPDPLQLSPFDYYFRSYVKYATDPAEKEWWEEGYGGFALQIAADHYHKENISGGPEHHIRVPAINDDPMVEESPWTKSFLDYLSSYLLWGGFSGYEIEGKLPAYYSDSSIMLKAKNLSSRFADLAHKYRAGN